MFVITHNDHHLRYFILFSVDCKEGLQRGFKHFTKIGEQIHIFRQNTQNKQKTKNKTKKK